MNQDSADRNRTCGSSVGTADTIISPIASQLGQDDADQDMVDCDSVGTAVTTGNANDNYNFKTKKHYNCGNTKNAAHGNKLQLQQPKMIALRQDSNRKDKEKEDKDLEKLYKVCEKMAMVTGGTCGTTIILTIITGWLVYAPVTSSIDVTINGILILSSFAFMDNFYNKIFCCCKRLKQYTLRFSF